MRPHGGVLRDGIFVLECDGLTPLCLPVWESELRLKSRLAHPCRSERSRPTAQMGGGGLAVFQVRNHFQCAARFPKHRQSLHGWGAGGQSERFRKCLRMSSRARRRGRLFFFSVHQPKLLHLVAQRVAADVQQLGCFDLIPVRLRQRHFESIAAALSPHDFPLPRAG